jgi:hypothetical protein
MKWNKLKLIIVNLFFYEAFIRIVCSAKILFSDLVFKPEVDEHFQHSQNTQSNLLKKQI